MRAAQARPRLCFASVTLVLDGQTLHHVSSCFFEGVQRFRDEDFRLSMRCLLTGGIVLGAKRVEHPAYGLRF